MARRRSSPDPLATVEALRWLVVRDRCSRALRWVKLPPKANLRVALEAERARLVADGWTADPVRRYSFVFCERDPERVCVSIECFEPGTPVDEVPAAERRVSR